MNAQDASASAQATVASLSLRQRCGQLLVVGFEGHELPPTIERDLSAGERGGVILFRRNLTTLAATAGLCRRVTSIAPPGLPPLIGIDEEGGRVSRLPAPFEALPAMRDLGRIGDESLVYRAASLVASYLRSLGITCNFAPVLDVDSNPANPIIGDRSFSDDATAVATLGLAFARGLSDHGIMPCGKHFPGHGDTIVDSHLGLPAVEHGLDRLERVELAPFRAAAIAGLASLMTAHIVFPQIDATGLPATLSAPVLQGLLRQRLGYAGVVFSDDLEMQAIADTWSVPDAACRAVGAGCDALLICRSELAARGALEALVAAAQADTVMERRIREAATRFLATRLAFAPAADSAHDDLNDVFASLRVSAEDLLGEMRSRLVAARKGLPSPQLSH